MDEPTKSSKTTNILAIQSYGFIESKYDMSPGAIGSRARILYAAMLVGTGVIDKKNLIAIFPQGYSKADPRGKHAPIGRLSLGEMMGRYLIERPEMSGVDVVCEPKGWGTYEDVENILSVGLPHGYTYNNTHINFVSDPVHIKRVRIVWNKVHEFIGSPDDMTASFFGATFHQMSFKERVVREFIARLWYRLIFKSRGERTWVRP